MKKASIWLGLSGSWTVSCSSPPITNEYYTGPVRNRVIAVPGTSRRPLNKWKPSAQGERLCLFGICTVSSRNAANLILTPDGYNRLYPAAGEVEHRYHAALETLRSGLISHSFLFIGLSLDDADLAQQLRGVHEIF